MKKNETKENINKYGINVCPECGYPLIKQGGCKICTQCGYEACEI